MTELNPQFYDQLAKRLDRQDSQLDRIEQNQLIAINTQTAHVASDKSHFMWIKIVGGAMWAAIVGIIGFLAKHLS